MPLNTSACPFVSLEDEKNGVDYTELHASMDKKLREINQCLAKIGSNQLINLGMNLPTSNQATGGPGGTNPGGTNPGGTNPGGTNPGGTNPGGTNPGGTNPGGANPGGTNPGGANPGGANPGGANPGGANPGGANPGGGAPIKPDVGCLTYEENLKSEYTRALSGQLENQYMECVNPTGQGGDRQNCLKNVYDNRIREIKSYCTDAVIQATNSYLQNLHQSIKEVRGSLANLNESELANPECTRANMVYNLTKVTATLASAIPRYGQAASAGINLLNESYILLKQQKQINKLQKLKVGKTFKENACTFYTFTRNDPDLGCAPSALADPSQSNCKNTEVMDQTNLNTLNTSVAALQSNPTPQPKADQTFSERDTLLKEMTEQFEGSFIDRLKQDREVLSKTSPESGQQHLEKILGSLKVKVNLCMKTSGVWTQKKGQLRDLCKDLLSCYHYRLFQKDGTFVNNPTKRCYMQNDADTYYEFLKGEVLGSGKGHQSMTDEEYHQYLLDEGQKTKKELKRDQREAKRKFGGSNAEFDATAEERYRNTFKDNALFKREKKPEIYFNPECTGTALRAIAK